MFTSPPGFRTIEAHRSLKTRGWLVGIFSIILQIVLPIGVVIAGFATLIAACSNAWNGPKLDPASAASHGGRVWFTVNALDASEDPKAPRRLVLMSAKPTGDDLRSERDLTAGDKVSVLTKSGIVVSASGRLFVFGEDQIEDIEAKKTIAYPEGTHGRPLVLDGALAIATKVDDAVVVSSLTADGWQERHRLPVTLPEGATISSLQLISIGGRLHGAVTTFDDELYSLTPEGEGLVTTLCSKDAADFVLSTRDGEAVVYYVTKGPGLDELLDNLEADERDKRDKRDKPKTELIASSLAGKQLWKAPLPGASAIGLVSLADGKDHVVSRQDSGIALRKIEAGGLGEPVVIGGKSFWDGYTIRFLGLAFLWLFGGSIITFFAAWLMARGMARHRLADETDRYASLTRRALARGVDFTIVLIIVVVVKLVGGETLAQIAAALMGLSFLVSEAVSGATPGKWLVGIRVRNLQGEPPGLGPAVVRALLLGVDTFFGGIVGVFTVAFSPRWQRVGDSVASTVVLRHRSVRADGTEHA